MTRLPRQRYASANELAEALYRLEESPFVGWDDLRFPSQGINPPGAATDPSRSTTTGLLVFSAAATNVVAGVAQMPHAWKAGTFIRPHIHYIGDSNPAAGATHVWTFDYKWVNNRSLVPSAYTTLNAQFPVAPYVNGLPTLEIGSLGTISGDGMRDSSCILWVLSRIGGAAADTYAGTVSLVEFDIHYQHDSFGSLEEIPR